MGYNDLDKGVFNLNDLVEDLRQHERQLDEFERQIKMLSNPKYRLEQLEKAKIKGQKLKDEYEDVMSHFVRLREEDERKYNDKIAALEKREAKQEQLIKIGKLFNHKRTKWNISLMTISCIVLVTSFMFVDNINQRYQESLNEVSYYIVQNKSLNNQLRETKSTLLISNTQYEQLELLNRGLVAKIDTVTLERIELDHFIKYIVNNTNKEDIKIFQRDGFNGWTNNNLNVITNSKTIYSSVGRYYFPTRIVQTRETRRTWDVNNGSWKQYPLARKTITQPSSAKTDFIITYEVLGESGYRVIETINISLNKNLILK